MNPMTTKLRLWAALMVATASTASVQAQFDSLRKLGRSDTESTKKIACFKVEGELTETPIDVPPLFGGDQPKALLTLLGQLRAAQHDDDVVAVVVDFQYARMGFAQFEELHDALQKFRVLDKDVYIHADRYSNISYALASAASHVSLVPTGNVWLMGLYGEGLYLKGMIDKIGAEADFERCTGCDYKSAVEMFTRTAPSEEADAMYGWLFDGLYERLVERIGKGRGFSPEKVRNLIDGGPYSSEEALKAGLVDSVQHRQDFIAELKRRYGDSSEFVVNYGEDEAEDLPQDFFSMFQALMKVLNPAGEEHTEPSVAVVYVDGAIVTGEAEQSPFGSSSGAYSTTIRKALDEAAADESVKAVVLRVASPGGSALASEIILDATRRVQAKKPLVVSMGAVAGSGGYYVACLADAIFASGGTITASIGVLGGKFVTTGMWDKLGVSWYPHKRGKMAGMFSTATGFNEDERAKLKEYMDGVYEIFINHVESGRGERLTKPIDELAGGRVFTGAQALKLGLVDKIGGLEDAIKFAAEKAGAVDYEIRVIPEPLSVFDFLLGESDDDEFARSAIHPRLGLFDTPMIRAALPLVAKTDPLRARAILRSLLGLELIHTEGAVMLMPVEFVIE
ncbi:MAG: signal peptide peptidase SppA [Phycisphaerales bacterium]|nr:MAG: signal peptide peptidase SppA [Phycisphaerales bacterium]